MTHLRPESARFFDEHEIDRTLTLRDAQTLVREFVRRNGWTDEPSVDKFDHCHEELIEMSRHLRYMSVEERVRCVIEKRQLFVDGIGDLLFAVCRLANQLDVDIERAFVSSAGEIMTKYHSLSSERGMGR